MWQVAGLSFSKPLFLILIPLAAAFVIYTGYKKNARFASVFKCAVRALFFALVILSLTGVSIRKISQDTTTVFVMDISESIMGSRNTEAIDFYTSFVNSAIAGATNNDEAGIVCFGGGSVVERMPKAPSSVTTFNSHVDGSYTNIAQPLLLARSIMPEESKKRITLVSDGLENVDSAEKAARLLKESGVVVDAFHYDNTPENEVQLAAFKIPRQLKQSVRYDIETEIYSTGENSCDIFIYKGDKLAFRQTVQLRYGANKFVFSDIADTYGAVIYRAEISPSQDTFHQNNKLYAYSYIEDAPHILVIGSGESAKEVSKILNSSASNVKTIQPQAAPDTVSGLSAYDGVVICDTNIEDFPPMFAGALELYVKNTGGGVVVTGGENSYALGGYYKTPLETLLPVNMELKDRENSPNLAMVVVLDRSGSMSASEYGMTRISLAKEAVIRSIDAMTEFDMYGVVTFDTESQWAVEFAEVGGSHQSIKDRVASIQPGGGTSILPALTEAYDVIKAANTTYKHIILLTDGEAEKMGYEMLLRQMNGTNVTLSCIAVGDGSDTELLKNLAGKGNGRYYYTDAFTDLPKIFTKETALAGKAYLNNRYFYPKYSPSAIMSGITSIPALSGYVSTTAKDTADIILTSDEGEPILAAWQYGLGRTAALTTDMNGMWSAEWLAGEGADIFNNTVSWVLRAAMSSEAELTAQTAGDKTELFLTLPYSQGIEKIEGVLSSSSGNEHNVEFSASAPGVYKGVVPETGEGAYIVGLSIQKGGETQNIALGFSVPYSKEFDITVYETGLALLRKIVDITGGRMITNAGSVFGEGAPVVYGGKDISGIFLLAAVIILLIDIALRRFTFILDSLQKFSIMVINKVSYKILNDKLYRKNDDKLGVGKKQPDKNIETNEIIKTEPAKQPGLEIKPETKADTASILLKNKNKRAGR